MRILAIAILFASSVPLHASSTETLVGTLVEILLGTVAKHELQLAERAREAYIAEQVIHGLAKACYEDACDDPDLTAKLTKEAELRLAVLEDCMEASENASDPETAQDSCVYEATKLNRWLSETTRKDEAK